MTDQNELVCPECGGNNLTFSIDRTQALCHCCIDHIAPIPRSEYEGKQEKQFDPMSFMCDECKTTHLNNMMIYGNSFVLPPNSDQLLVDRELLERLLNRSCNQRMTMTRANKQLDDDIAQLQALLKKDSDHE